MVMIHSIHLEIMGGSHSLERQRKGVCFDQKQPLEDQLHAVQEDCPIARLKPFIFHTLQLRISVQASWCAHCLYDDEGVIHSYLQWQDHDVPLTERGPFPLHKATAFQLGIQWLDGTYNLLDPHILAGTVTDDIVEALNKCRAGEEVISAVPKAVVVQMLNQLAEAETSEYSEQMKRIRERDAVYREELVHRVNEKENS